MRQIKSNWQQNLQILAFGMIILAVLLAYGINDTNQKLRTINENLSIENSRLQWQNDSISNLDSLFLKQKILEALPLSVKLTYEDISYDVYILDISKSELGLHLWNKDGFPLHSFKELEQQLGLDNKKLTFAMNAGMYLSDYNAQGLFIANGQKQKEIDLSDSEQFLNFYLKPNGIFFIRGDSAQIIKSEQFAQFEENSIELATQSGPLMIFNDTIHPAFRESSPNVNIRNGVGLINSTIAVFAISNEPVNFYDFATFFRDRMKCSNALYLDGVISSSYLPELGRFDKGTNLGPIFAVFQ